MTDPTPAEITQVLRRWFEEPTTATWQPLGAGSGFSAARLWKVDYAGASYVLRKLPRSTGSVRRQFAYQALQEHLAHNGIPAPRLILTLSGAGLLVREDPLTSGRRAVWSVNSWVPGVADYWENPRSEKLRAAMTILAQAHRCAESCTAPSGRQQLGVAPSPAMAKRHKRLTELNLVAIREMLIAAASCADAGEKALAREAIKLVEATVDGCRRQAGSWVTTPLPLQWRLGDVWHDHVLFSGDRVTGLIDFAAADIDSPAGDVARLLGSLVGDDSAEWQEGLAAYESVRPLSAVEHAAARFFDASGSVISAANWIGWLWPMNPGGSQFTGNRPAGIGRLKRLLPRLRTLAAVQSGTFA